MSGLHPTTTVMAVLLGYVVLLSGRGTRHERWLVAVAALAATLAPWGIALMAWDWSRFFLMAQFHAYVLTVMVASSPPRPHAAGVEHVALSLDTTDSAPPWGLLGIAALALLTVGLSMGMALPRVAGNDEDERPFALRVASHYACGALLFPNSDFGTGRLVPWQPEGEGRAFHQQPFTGDLPARRGHPARPFHEWLGTSEVYGPLAVGTLVSPPFNVAQDRIAFRVGGDIAASVYVSLMVDEREVRRASPRGGEALETVRWDVARWRGRRARIRVVDQSETGHLNVEGFCYLR